MAYLQQLDAKCSKTKFMVFSYSKSSTYNISLSLDQKELGRIEIIKFLGVFLDNNLTWKRHIIKS